MFCIFEGVSSEGHKSKQDNYDCFACLAQFYISIGFKTNNNYWVFERWVWWVSGLLIFAGCQKFAYLIWVTKASDNQSSHGDQFWWKQTFLKTFSHGDQFSYDNQFCNGDKFGRRFIVRLSRFSFSFLLNFGTFLLFCLFAFFCSFGLFLSFCVFALFELLVLCLSFRSLCSFGLLPRSGSIVVSAVNSEPGPARPDPTGCQTPVGSLDFVPPIWGLPEPSWGSPDPNRPDAKHR